MKIITGKTGKPHVTSADDRALNMAAWGNDGFLSGRYSEPQVIDANTIRIMPCDILFQGCHARILPGEYEDMAIESGAAGYNRIDRIVARYTIDDDGLEAMTLVVIKGDAVADSPAKPNYVVGTIGTDRIADMPLWTVPITGITLGDPVAEASILPCFADKVGFRDVYTTSEVDERIQIVENEVQSAYNVASEAASNANDASSTAKSALSDAGAANDRAEDAYSTATSASRKVDANEAELVKVTKIACAGRVISKAFSQKFTFAEGSGSLPIESTDTQTFTVPAGTNAVIGVVKSISSGCTFKAYEYTIKDGTCTFSVTASNEAPTKGSIVMVLICIAPALAMTGGAV